MTQLKDAFRREAKIEDEKTTRCRLHWRHKEDSWKVVSSTLDWNNVTRPKDHDDFITVPLQGEGGDTIDRYQPEDPGAWETFVTDDEEATLVFDEQGHNELIKALRSDVQYLQAEEVAEFLHGRFTVEYGVYLGENDCRSCDGTGARCTADECYTYCTNGCGDPNEKTRISDDACSCTSCNYESHWEPCDACDGTGSIDQGMMTREFPYTRDKILSEMPSRDELQAVQFALNRLGGLAHENDTFVPPEKVLQMFDLLEHDKYEELVEYLMQCIMPALPKVEQPKRDLNGDIVTDDNHEPVMVEKVDPDEKEKARVQLESALLDKTLGRMQSMATAD